MYSKTLAELVKKAYLALQEYLNLPSLESLKKIDWTDIGSALATLGSVIMLIVFSAFMLWIIRAVGLYKMAKDKNDKYAFLAFVPYGGTFVMGRIVRKNQAIWNRYNLPRTIAPNFTYYHACSWWCSII